MLSPFLGMLLTLATGAAIGLGFLMAIWAGMRGNRYLARLATVGVILAAVTYGAFYGLGLVLARERVLPRGQAVRFCGLDCHLHVQVEAARPGAVVVRFSSNAVRVPEYPAGLRFRVVDAAGNRHRPVNEVPDRGLGPGESFTWELILPQPVDPAGATLEVTRRDRLAWLVPGSGNPLVQRQTRLALVAAPAGS